MPINTDLNISPYFDDYDENKDFYKVLFRPGVSVQARELNQLQTILQKQIERFGDAVFRTGTIIEGCAFKFEKIFPFVKIKDTETNGTAVNVNDYVDKYVQSLSTKLKGHVLAGISGFESADPDLNTLYVRYTDSGTSKTATSFSAGETLRVYDNNLGVWGINIIDGSTGISNNYSVVFVSAIAVQNTEGGTSFGNSFVVGGNITQSYNGVTANAVITGIDSTTNSEALILKIRPNYGDLTISNTSAWTFNLSRDSTELVSLVGNSAANGNIVGIIGSGATASLTTDSILGSVTSVEMVTRGSGYYIPPFAGIGATSSGAQTSISGFTGDAKNYYAEISVAENITTPAVGNGYAFSIGSGVIYQKGYFSRVDAQRVIVEKYNGSPDQKVIGFDTRESIVNSNIDATLLDNATGTYNYNAPGANRLELKPYLVVLDKVDAYANDEFFSVVEFSNGQPYKQNRTAQFNTISRELAKRTFEESGNYVLDPFFVYTRSANTMALEANSFTVVIDPGLAYIDGYRVETSANYYEYVNKAVINAGVDTNTNNVVVDVNYGNYIRVNEVGGAWKFNIGDDISLRGTAATYLTTGGLGTPTGAGSEIGKARFRSMVYESGEPGTPSAVYRLYLFDIQMNAGQNFRNVRSVYYNGTGTKDAVADVVLTLDGTTNSNVAVLQDRSKNKMLFYSGVDALKNANNINYTYRTYNDTATLNASAQSTITLVTTGESWPYTGSLSSTEKQDLIIVPLANAFAVANGGGSISIQSGNTIVTGTSTTFGTDYAVGDYIRIGNSSTGDIRRIASIANNTRMTIAVAGSFTCTSANGVLSFPQFVPVPFASRSNRTASVTGNSLTISLGNTLNAVSTSLAITYNVRKSANSTTIPTKTAKRKRFVKIRVANNEATVAANAAGSVSVATNSVTVTGTSTSFTTAFEAGDYVALWSNATNWYLRQVDAVANATSLTLTTNSAIANASANIAKVTSVNLDGPWSLGVPDVFRMRTVHSGTDSNITTSSDNIGRNFYIDHNQNEDFYDTSYLMKDPKSTLSIGFDDWFLVSFDQFEVSGEGFKYLASYNVDDTKTLANSDLVPENSTIHTVEIPEVYSKTGEYFDLRDHFDLRPYANAVITPANNSTYATNSPINPSIPPYANKFSSADKYFPAPESDITATVENYLPRTDAVVVTSNGYFKVIKGEPNNKVPPKIPASSVLLNYLEVPAYPSLPMQLSANLALMIDTNMANELYTRRRTAKYRIRTPLSATNIAENQPRRYTMEQIGELERRISDLEYYVTLTQIEDKVKNQTILSSNDPNLNRFKFGYFVDNFSTTDFADADNPEYSASIFGLELNPRKQQINLDYKFDILDDNTRRYYNNGKLVLPYSEYALVQQLNATDGPVAISSPPVVNAVTNAVTNATSNSGFGIIPPDYNPPNANVPVSNTPVSNTPVVVLPTPTQTIVCRNF